MGDGKVWPGAGAIIACAVGPLGLLAVHGAAVLFGEGAVDGLGGAIGVGRDGRVVPDILDDAAEEGGERGYLAGTKERQGVILNNGGPVGLVGVERMEEVLLDPVTRRRRRLACFVWFWHRAEARHIRAGLLGNMAFFDQYGIDLGSEIWVEGGSTVICGRRGHLDGRRRILVRHDGSWTVAGVSSVQARE